MHTGHRIRELRELAAVGQRELDRITGLPEGTTWAVERSKDVLAATVSVYAWAFGVTNDHLIDGTGRKPSRRSLAAALQSAEANRQDRPQRVVRTRKKAKGRA